MLRQTIRLGTLVFACCVHAFAVEAQNDGPRPRIEEWPQFGYGHTTGFFRRGSAKVDLEGLVLHYVANFKWYPDYLGLDVRYEQALAIADQQKAQQAVLASAWIKLNEAEQRGDQDAIKNALRHKSNVLGMVTETADDMFKETMVHTFDERQLETIKSMCINVAMNHLGFRDLLNRNPQLIAEFGLTPSELADIRQAMAEAEMELQREVMELRRQAWDKVMKKLPPPLVEKLEDELGFGGLKKPK